jgi:WD40 repeat protein
VARFKGKKHELYLAEISPDGKILATGGGDRNGGELTLWDLSTGKEIASLPGFTGPAYSLAFSADGKRLASGGGESVQVWDVTAHKELASVKGVGDARPMAMNRDGTRVAAMVEVQQAKLWEVASGKELASFQLHVGFYSPLGAPFSRDLATLAGRNYQEIDLWDIASGKEKATLSEHRGQVLCTVWSADDKTLIASSTRYEDDSYKRKGDVKLWDVTTGKERATLPGPFGSIQEMAPSPDGKTLALLDSPELHAEPDLKLVDVDTGRQQVLRVPPRCRSFWLHFTTEGKLLVTGASADALRVWEVSLPKRDR